MTKINNEEIKKNTKNNDCNCNQEKCNCEKDKERNCKHENCNCGEHCDCGDDCTCGEDCDCGCQDGHDCTCGDKADEYLNLARQIQADFENFRKHAIEDIKSAKVLGQVSVIEVFLPCLDTFKLAKKSIKDETALDGINMIEDKLLSDLKSLGVEKIETIGKVYNPHFHNVIALGKDETKEKDIIIDEYEAGYTFSGKVIRYSKVIVNS